MAFKPRNLNNLAGSLGKTNLWVYEDEDEDLTTIQAGDFFTPAKSYNVHERDIMFVHVSDGVAPGKMVVGTTPSDLKVTPLDELV